MRTCTYTIVYMLLIRGENSRRKKEEGTPKNRTGPTLILCVHANYFGIMRLCNSMHMLFPQPIFIYFIE